MGVGFAPAKVVHLNLGSGMGVSKKAESFFFLKKNH